MCNAVTLVKVSVAEVRGAQHAICSHAGSNVCESSLSDLLRPQRLGMRRPH